MAWPPTYKGGYENLYKFINAQRAMSETPGYGVSNADQLPAWLDELDSMGAKYCVFVDHENSGRKPVSVYFRGRMHTVFSCSRTRPAPPPCHNSSKSEPFKLRVAIDTGELTRSQSLRSFRSMRAR